jgi:hypothetical protein
MMATRSKTQTVFSTNHGERNGNVPGRRAPIFKGVHVRTGLPVIDADEGLHIEVTAAAVEKAEPWDCRHCALSECARETIDGLVDVEFYYSQCLFIFTDHVLRYRIANSTANQVKIFDMIGQFPPGTYWLSAVPPNQKSGKRKPGKRLPTNAVGPQTNIDLGNAPHLPKAVRMVPSE